MWYIVYSPPHNLFSVGLRITKDIIFGDEKILLQRCGEDEPTPPLSISGVEWDELVALVEAHRTKRAAEAERNNIALEETRARSLEEMQKNNTAPYRAPWALSPIICDDPMR